MGEPTITQAYGDKVCDECGAPNPCWFADNTLWNRSVGGPNAVDDPGGVLCPNCFMAKADLVYHVTEVNPNLTAAIGRLEAWLTNEGRQLSRGEVGQPIYYADVRAVLEAVKGTARHG